MLRIVAGDKIRHLRTDGLIDTVLATASHSAVFVATPNNPHGVRQVITGDAEIVRHGRWCNVHTHVVGERYEPAPAEDEMPVPPANTPGYPP
jgi:hypothetical protein